MNKPSAYVSRPWHQDDIPDLTGRLAVVTGANSGLGFQTAARLAEHGARVVLACRNLEKADRAVAAIIAAQPSADLAVEALDLADLASVRAFAQRMAARVDRVDMLVNNAGIMAVPKASTADGFEAHLGTNHLGHVALTALLLPQLQNAGAARVVTVSSVGHWAGRIHLDDLMLTRRYRRWPAYWQSKLANLLFTYELQRLLEGAGSDIIAVAAHPGASATELGKSQPIQRVVFTTLAGLMQPAADGALPSLRAATDPEVRGGDYFGPAGRLQVAGPPVRVRASRASRDPELARRLWERSAQLVGVDLDAAVAGAKAS